jgi:hypothetical protein
MCKKMEGKRRKFDELHIDIVRLMMIKVRHEFIVGMKERQ